MTAADMAVILVKVLVMTGAVMTLGVLLTWVERKQSAVIQDRIGANRAALFGLTALGLFHPLADALKLLTKEDFVPPEGEARIHALAPILALVTAVAAFAVIPAGPPVTLFGRAVRLQVADPGVGLLFVFVAGGLSVYAVVLAGWASANRYALLGALRAAAQALSYEVPMGLSVIGLLMVFGSLSIAEMTRAQGELLWGWLPRWGVVVQPVGFLVFFTAAVAETKRIPFDLPEGESEIVGFFVEYSGMRFALLWIGEFIEIVVVAGLVAALYFGGWQVPFLESGGMVFPWGGRLDMAPALVAGLRVAAFVAKVIFFCWLQMMIRWTLPRFRYDQLMALGWKGLVPLALANILLTGIALLAVGEAP